MSAKKGDLLRQQSVLDGAVRSMKNIFCGPMGTFCQGWGNILTMGLVHAELCYQAGS